MIDIKGAHTHLRGNPKELVGDFLRMLIAIENNPVASFASKKAMEIYKTGSYEICDDLDEGDPPTIFVHKPSGEENAA